MKRKIAALLLGLAAASPAWAATKARAPDGSHLLVNEAIVDAAPADVWAAISTAEGWKSWAVPVAWTPAPDLIETSYAPTAKPGDPSTIRQQILLRVPGRLMVFRTVKAPEGFPDFDTYAKVVSAFELEPAGDGRTRVRLTGTGYEDSEAGRRLLGFFEKGNQASLDALKARFAKAARRLPRCARSSSRCASSSAIAGAASSRTARSTSIASRAPMAASTCATGMRSTAPDAPYRGETLYSWDGAAKRVGYTYWNSSGGVSRGSMAAKGEALDFGDETYTGADGRKLTISTLWRKVGADSYEAVSRSGADPTGSRVVRYTRVD